MVNRDQNSSPGSWISFVSNNWPVFLFLVSVGAAILGKLIFGISLFHPLQRLALEQAESKRQIDREKYKREMIQRHIDLGTSFLNDIQLEAAEAEFRKALLLEPFNSRAHMGQIKSQIWAQIESRGFEPSVLEKRLDLIRKEDPDDAHAFIFEGDIWQSQMFLDKALESYEKAMHLDTTLTAAASFRMGTIYTLRNQFDLALEKYQLTNKLSPRNSGYLDNLSYQFYLNGDFEKAVAYSDTLTRLDPEYLPGYVNLAKSYRVTGDFSRALFVQENLVDLLNDERIVSLEKNKYLWFFPTKHGGRPVYLNTLKDKRYYVHRDIALTYMCLGHYERAAKFIELTGEQYSLEQLYYNQLSLSDIGKLSSFDELFGDDLLTLLEERPNSEFIDNLAPFYSIHSSTTSPVNTEEWYAQLGAMHSREYAQSFARYLQNTFVQLSEAFFIHTTADSPEENSWNFVRVGPFVDRNNAKVSCDEFQSLGFDCFPTQAVSNTLITNN